MECTLKTALIVGALALLSVLLVSRKHHRKGFVAPPIPHNGPDSSQAQRLREAECLPYKEMYFKLHNLERHADVLAEARSALLSLLSESLLSATRADCAMLSLRHYTDAGLDRFVEGEMEAVMQDWRRYLARRGSDGPRELFDDAPGARWWLTQRAPSKLVDGAWLGHVHKITTPFALRRVTKAAWQVLSEELGDGRLEKCHAQLYARLLRQVGAQLPAPDSRDFLSVPGMDDVGVWRSALAQLLVSLFPEDFLPEILGFNLSFEIMTLDTLVASKELAEVGIDPYYFTLHLTIDNADTGHTAMASQIVKDYLDIVARQWGAAAVQQAWRRVQAGFMLSKYTEQCSEADLTTQIGSVFLNKSIASRGIHEHCPASIGGRALSTWLDPDRLRDRQWQQDFVQSLASSRPWVYKGDSKRSRLLQQVSWGGLMFGAFTDREILLLRAWIESLVPAGPGQYEAFTGRGNCGSVEIRKRPDKDMIRVLSQRLDSDEVAASSKLVSPARFSHRKLLPLWFAHSCLLESAVAVPWHVTNATGCAIVRLLRAQYGFSADPVGIDGLDEMRRDDYVDLVDIGLDMLARAEPDCLLPESLGKVLAKWPSPFAEMMLAAGRRPGELLWTLIGISQAFADLHDVIAASPTILSESRRNALRQIGKREMDSLQSCVASLRLGSPEFQEYQEGIQSGLVGD